MEKRILLLADAASPHIEKWATAIAGKGFKVGLFSLNKTTWDWYKNNPNIVLLNEPQDHSNADFLVNKLKYLFLLPKLRHQIKAFQPDVLHAHYASSYGLLGALSGFRPFVISAWGSDVFEFPRKSAFHRYLLKFNLRRADKVLATSYALKAELRNYGRQDVQVIPFGVNTGAFYPDHVKAPAEEEAIHVGTIKSMEDKYGIKTILEAFRLVKQQLPHLPFRFFFVGGGSRLGYYQEMAKNLQLAADVIFTGKVPFKNVPYYHNLLDIFLNVSIVDESFGVSVIEAMACEKPVIVTHAPGLREIVNNDRELGILVERENAEQLALAIIKLALSPGMRLRMGKAARKHVMKHYDFKACLEQTTALYHDFLRRSDKHKLHYDLNYDLHPQEPAL